MKTQINGLHHITAFARDPASNLKFYVEVLGQRLVKKTVNFDDPGTYHIYYADRSGTPGTVITFFPIPNIRHGKPGAGSVTHIAYNIPSGSLQYWITRLAEYGVESTSTETRFGEKIISFVDPDGLQLELIESEKSLKTDFWAEGGVPEKKSIRGFHSLTATVHRAEDTAKILETELGYRKVGEDENRCRYETGQGGPGTWVDILTAKSDPVVVQGSGIVHHIAFSTPGDDTQKYILKSVSENGYNPSAVRDRQYFHSIYFNEPNGILFEVATDIPGFAIDEPIEELGTNLKLPPQYENYRHKIEKTLPSLNSTPPNP